MDKYVSDNYSEEIFTDDEYSPSKVAIFKNGNLVEFLCLLGPEVPQLGSIHIAKIHQVFRQHGLATAEIENGSKISVRLSNEKVSPGELVTVTISSEPRDGKPARGVLGAQLAGKNVILFPGNKNVRRYSNKLKFNKEKEVPNSFQDILAGLPEDFGFILRRNFMNAEINLVSQEIEILIDDWKRSTEPLRSFVNIREPKTIYTGISLLKSARIIAPLAKQKLFKSDNEWFSILEELQKVSVTKYVTNKDVTIWFQSTKALTAIDVDSAGSKRGPEELILHVAENVMRQIRLRQISGVILIDMPRLSNKGKKNFLLFCSKYIFADIRHPDIYGFGPAGLFEMSIRHRQMPLLDRLKAMNLDNMIS